MKPGTRIFTDGWAGYRCLNQEGYKHFSVINKTNYKQTYINSVTGEVVTPTSKDDVGDDTEGENMAATSDAEEQNEKSTRKSIRSKPNKDKPSEDVVEDDAEGETMAATSDAEEQNEKQ